MKTVIYPGPSVGADPGPHYYSARLGVHLDNGVPAELDDDKADVLLATGTVRLAPEAKPTKAEKQKEHRDEKAAAGAPLDKGHAAP
jgi:hypothetical protein